MNYKLHPTKEGYEQFFAGDGFGDVVGVTYNPAGERLFLVCVNYDYALRHFYIIRETLDSYDLVTGLFANDFDNVRDYYAAAMRLWRMIESGWSVLNAKIACKRKRLSDVAFEHYAPSHIVYREGRKPLWDFRK